VLFKSCKMVYMTPWDENWLDISQNILFYVPQKRESHTGLE